jgi:hypothetical protein
LDSGAALPAHLATPMKKPAPGEGAGFSGKAAGEAAALAAVAA